MVFTDTSNPFGMTAALPVTIITVMVSPMARPIPSITAVEIPEIAAGTVMRYMVCHLVAPSASDPSFKNDGTECIASSDMDMICLLYTSDAADEEDSVDL